MLFRLQHQMEKKGKNTACHAKIIAPDDVEIYVHPLMPDDLDETNAVVLYPSENAQTIDQILSQNVEQKTNFSLKYVVFIDSTWQLSKGILRDPRVQKLPRVKIHQHKTLFWRNQKFDEHFLSTIEAIHYFFREFHESTHQGNYNGEYDDLLYLFLYQYELIQQHYRQNTEITFKTDKRSDYIKL
jgi:DTW domain-containing protein YfiP